jgi:hypothetical protein
MSRPRDVHRATTRVLSTILVVLGVAMVASTVARGGGPLALGVIVGAMFVALGAGRLYLATKGG